jgi:hypothetical protein
MKKMELVQLLVVRKQVDHDEDWENDYVSGQSAKFVTKTTAYCTKSYIPSQKQLLVCSMDARE